VAQLSHPSGKQWGLGGRWMDCVTATEESGPNKDNKTQALTGQG